MFGEGKYYPGDAVNPTEAKGLVEQINNNYEIGLIVAKGNKFGLVPKGHIGIVKGELGDEEKGLPVKYSHIHSFYDGGHDGAMSFVKGLVDRLNKQAAEPMQSTGKDVEEDYSVWYELIKDNKVIGGIVNGALPAEFYAGNLAMLPSPKEIKSEDKLEKTINSTLKQ